ncbi:purple acid phosphatase 22-like [Impatiens glandulifera]|uniref:purple acid phosphatase 22-like n=1 Tax=Impatiens glandulifera TaxID=253017 RepID=UPI001FB0C8D9|nr:purple acid phosphatase 22-like [Impatiens glandulifera]
MDRNQTTFSLLLFLFLSHPLLFHATNSPHFVRQPPRPVVFTDHHRSNSDPQQVHISLAGKNFIRVSWITSDHQSPSSIDYGKSPGKYDVSVIGENTKYSYFFYNSGKIHEAVIGPLDPGTTYYYRCSGSGPEFIFKTPPSNYPIEFAIIGDLGQTEWTASTLAHIRANDYDVLLLPGDLSYADTHQPLWDSFGRFVESEASKRPWMVTEGNHEIEKIPILQSHGFIAYNSRWPMAYKESGSTSNLYYSFDVAPGIHILMLGSYTDFDADSAQYKWLVADLAKVDRTITPWLFALVHAPWYNSNEAHKGEGESMRKAMEELLYNAKVDIVFAGHVHAYERFTRVFDNNEDQNGPIYITIGDGGNREGLALSFEKPSPTISLYREPSFGHGRLRIFNSTHAHWSWHRNNDTNAVVGDEVWFKSLATSISSNEVLKLSNDEF